MSQITRIEAIDPIAVLDSQIAELRASGHTGNVENLVEVRECIADLIAFAKSFSFTITDSFYMDAYLHVEFPKGESSPHGKSITYRLPTPSSMSPDLAEIERMRADALARVATAR